MKLVEGRNEVKVVHIQKSSSFPIQPHLKKPGSLDQSVSTKPNTWQSHTNALTSLSKDQSLNKVMKAAADVGGWDGSRPP